MRVRRGLIIGILVVQVLAVGYARTTESRYLSWAPYDQISFYEVDVEVDGELLSPAAVVDRYPLGLWVDDNAARGRENRSMAHVRHLIERREGQLDEMVAVTLTWSTNGGEAERWALD